MLRKFSLTISMLDLFSLFPIVFFLFITYRFFGEPASMDPMVTYRWSSQFISGGIPEILKTGVTLHPPALFLLNSFVFILFGKQPSSYNFVGAFIFFLSTFVLYFTTRNVWGRKIAILLTLLLFCNPFIIIDSFYLTDDVLILFGIIIALSAYVFNKKLLLSVFFVFLAIMKETALVVVFSFTLSFLIDAVGKKERRIKNLILTLSLFLPAIFTLLLWQWYLHHLGTTSWKEIGFVKTNDSSFVTVMKTLRNLHIFTMFFFQNIRNAFFLHFQWVYTLVFFVSIEFLLVTKKIIFFKNLQQRKYLTVLMCIGLLYILFVFTFPTWTVPRYGIPVFLPLFFFLSFCLSHVKKYLFIPVVGIMFVIMIISNFFSLDPLSRHFGMKTLQGERIYDIPFQNSGPDRMIYNVQFLRIVKRQNAFIQRAIASNADTIIAYCDELKLGEKVWSINIHNNFYPSLTLHKHLDCVNDYAVDKDESKKMIQGKIIFITKTHTPQIDRLITSSYLHSSQIIVDQEE